MYTASASFSMTIENGKTELKSFDVEFNGYRNGDLLERALTDYNEPRQSEHNKIGRIKNDADDEFWYYLYYRIISKMRKKKKQEIIFYTVY